MLDALLKFRENPLKTLFVTVFAVICGILASWEPLTGEHLLPFLDKRGWLEMPFWYHVLVIVLLCTTLVFQGLVVKAFCQFVRWKRVRWLEDLAQSDSARMDQLVRLERQGLSTTSFFNALDPYIIFGIPIFNGSIYTLTLEEKVESGFIFEEKLGKEPTSQQVRLIDEPKIVGWPPNTGRRVEAHRSQYFHIAIRQRIPQSVVSSIEQRGGGMFWAQNIIVRFTYRDYTGERKTLPFTINEFFSL